MNKKIVKLVFALGIVAAATAFGQESGVVEPEKTTLWGLIVVGGWAMWPLGLLSFGAIYFVVQNFLTLKESTLLRPDLMPTFIQLMQERKVLEAHSLCKQNETMFTYVFAAGLERCATSGDINFGKVKEAIEEASTEQLTTYMKPIDYLSIIGATSPMVGLLGTVSGMIKAFETIGTAGMKPTELAKNIGEALVTTATGLIIAIPASIFFFYFRNNFIKSVATLGRSIGALLDTLETGELPLGFNPEAGFAYEESPVVEAE